MKFVKAVAPGIKTKAFEDLSNELWIGLNTYTSLDDKRAFAKDMADMFVDRMLIDAGDADSKDTDKKYLEWEKANRKLAYLKPAIDSIGSRAPDISKLMRNSISTIRKPEVAMQPRDFFIRFLLLYLFDDRILNVFS